MNFFFFQAEDGIRDFHVTGVQTCALPIYLLQTILEVDPRAGDRIYLQNRLEQVNGRGPTGKIIAPDNVVEFREIGRASCRERVRTAAPSVCRRTLWQWWDRSSRITNSLAR